MRTLALLLLLVSPVALGQSAIFKCVDAKGDVTYQNRACPSDTDVADIREYEPISREEALRAERERQQRIATEHAEHTRATAQQRQQQAQVPRQQTTAQRKRQQCNAAKAARDQARKNAPLWRGVHYLEPWEERVREACKGLW